MEGRRVRTLTEKDAESYQGTLDGFRWGIRIIEQRTNFECNVFRDGNLDRENVDKSLRIISDSLRDYTNLTKELLSWLARCNTADSLHELDIQRDLINVFKTEIEASIKEMQRHLKSPVNLLSFVRAQHVKVDILLKDSRSTQADLLPHRHFC